MAPQHRNLIRGGVVEVVQQFPGCWGTLLKTAPDNLEKIICRVVLATGFGVGRKFQLDQIKNC